MRILDAQVDWREGVANEPRLQVLVDETPDRSELRFGHDNGIWCAIQNGYVEYFAWSGDGNDGGYSGHCFEITTVDGEQVTLKGPWSSRAGCVNLRRFGPVVDVQLTTDPEILDHGGTFRSGTLTLSAAKQAIDLVNADCHLERRRSVPIVLPAPLGPPAPSARPLVVELDVEHHRLPKLLTPRVLARCEVLDPPFGDRRQVFQLIGLADRLAQAPPIVHIQDQQPVMAGPRDNVGPRPVRNQLAAPLQFPNLSARPALLAETEIASVQVVSGGRSMIALSLFAYLFDTFSK